MKSTAAIACLLLLCAGCAAHNPARSRSTALNPNAFPFILQGDDTSIQLDFSTPLQSPPEPQQLFRGEVCRLIVGSSTIECFPDGSALLLGPGDGFVLVDGNPIWNVHPAAKDPNGAELLRLYSTFFLIAGSIEKLPDGLLDYLDDPGPRRGPAMNLLRQLIADNGGKCLGVAPGGHFQVLFQLTQAGKDKLVDALNSIEADSGIHLVKLSHGLENITPPAQNHPCLENGSFRG